LNSPSKSWYLYNRKSHFCSQHIGSFSTIHNVVENIHTGTSTHYIVLKQGQSLLNANIWTVLVVGSPYEGKC